MRPNPAEPRRPLVRASDIGLWAECHRAWHLARNRQIPHREPARLAQGVHVHQSHGRHLRWAQQLRWAGSVLMALGLLLALLQLALWLLT
jgi:hypothetical protein